MDASIDFEDGPQEGHRDVVQAISMLEDVLPNIEQPIGIYIALFDLYMDLDDMIQAGACLVEAARRVSLGQMSDLTHFMYNHLELFSQISPEAFDVQSRLTQIISRDETDLGKNTVHLDQRKLYKVDLIPELLLSQHLLRSHQISDPEYYILVNDLCTYSNQALSFPNTVLGVLRKRELPHEQAFIEFLTRDSGVPYIDLKLVNPTQEQISLLGPEFILVRGAVPFGEVANEPLIAVLDPFNLQLRDDVEALIQRPCHYFQAEPKGFAHLLESLDAKA